MPALSTIGPALTFLLSSFLNSPQLGGAGVDVINGVAAYVEGGTIPGTSSASSAVWVGWSPDPLVTDAIEFESPPPTLGGQRDLEQYTIHCCAANLTSDATVGNMLVAQQAALSIYAAAREIITLNRNLGGLQGMASIVKGAMTQTQIKNLDAQGVKVEIAFDVEVKAFQSYQP